MTRTLVQFAAEIVTQVRDEFKFSEQDFRRSRQPRHVKARSTAISRLREAGFGVKAISRAMNLDVTSVEYWLYPKSKARRNATRLRRYHKASA